jgi:putative hydrolase of the HAD superfamily
LRKPDPRIFELACERVGVPAERSAHVGDHMYADVIGARAAGMRPVLIDRRGDAGIPACRGASRITTLDRLEEALW